MNSSLLCRAAVLALALLVPGLLHLRAQEASLVSGYVSNAATQAYLEGARIETSNGRLVFTDRDGRYELAAAPGTLTLRVSYTGLAPQTVTVDVARTGATTRNVALTSDIYRLEKFTVGGVREGQALAITRQQQALNVKNVVASDTFGTIANGNIGALLQQLPGVSAIYNDSEARSVMIRGIDAGLNTVSMDGNQVASPSSTGFSRAFEFEQTSLGAIETIEVTKSPTPDMAANSIGGNVNLVTKSSFDRADKRFISYAAGGVYRPKYRTRGDSWWREPLKNIGPVLNLTYGDRFGAAEQFGALFSLNIHGRPGGDTAALINYQTVDTSPAYIVNFQIPRPSGAAQTRVALGGKFDYKLSPRLILSLNTGYNWYHETNDTRALLIATGNSAANFRPGYTNTFQEVIPNAASSATMTLSNDDISGRTIILAPSLRYRSPAWDLDAGANYSNGQKWWEYYPDGDNHYKSRPKAQVVAVLRGIGYTIDRTKSLEWPAYTQTAGPDLYDLRNYNTGVLARFLDKGVSDTIYGAQANARRKFTAPVPAWVKAGVNFQQQDRKNWNHSRTFNHVGPDGLLNTADDHLGAFLDTTGKYGDTNQGYRGPPWANPFAVARYVVDVPQNWREDLAYRFNQYSTNDRRITEKISAAYVMGNVELGRLNVLAGVRVERTETDALGPFSVGTPAVVVGKQRRQGDYQEVFPGVHLKYAPVRGLVARASYATSIGRPSFDSLIPLDTVNDNTQTVTSRNAGLKPQFSDNFDLSLEYYFEPVGLLSAGVFRKNVTDFQFTDTSRVVPSGSDNGFGGAYAGYRLSTTSNGGKARYQGFELNYQQQFTFLPGMLKGFGLGLNYTQLTTEGDYGGATATSLVAGFVPKVGNIQLSYVLNKFDLRLNTVWRGEYLVTNGATLSTLVWQKAKTQLDLRTKYNLSRRLGFFLDVENLNRSPVFEQYRGFADRPSQTRYVVQKFVGGIQGRF